MKKIIYLFLVLPLIFSSCAKEEGCKDTLATNYNADAEEDDGSCLSNITGIWSVDDYILNGVSLFSSAAGNSLTSMAVSLYADGTSWSLAYYSDVGGLGPATLKLSR